MLSVTDTQRALRSDLQTRLGSTIVSNDDADRIAYARDLWPRQQIRTQHGAVAVAPPALIVWPNHIDEVSEVVRFAAERGVPIVPYGAGSGVCGGVLPTDQTIVMDMKKMRSIERVDDDRLRCDAQAGIIGQHLEEGLEARGFTLGHFPSSIICSTLGGWVAGRSAGQCSGRYGKIEDMVTSLRIVDGRGEQITATEGGANGELLPLIIGSEGVLCAITDVSVRVSPAPTYRAFSSWLFDSTEDGLDAIRRIYQAGLRPAVARLYDPFDSMISRTFKKGHSDREIDHAATPGLAIRTLTKVLRRPSAINRLISATPDSIMGGAKLVLVWEDHQELADFEKHQAEKICLSYAVRDTGEAPARHWIGHRHSVSYRQSPLFAAGAFVDTMEVAAPWSRLWPMYGAVRRALSKNVFVMAHFSHAYPDGASIYFTFVGSGRDEEHALQLYDDTWRQALHTVIESGGTLSHHHGVGRSKAPAMRQEQGHAIEVVRALKRTMDPHNIFNPGALIPNHEVVR
ncbi:MAG: FAD-binding oxidoreductase [Polyangiales bacterium]